MSEQQQEGTYSHVDEPIVKSSTRTPNKFGFTYPAMTSKLTLICNI